MNEIINAVRESAGGALNGVSDGIIAAMCTVGGLLIILSIFAFIVSAFLGIAYIKYNRRKNSINLSGKNIAREILDNHGLTSIKVSSSGSIMFGNSYSHYFKKVRLRRMTWKKSSISSLAMAVQKSALAILDKEGDADMKRRVKLTPVIYFGPLAFVPLVLIGVLLDVLVFNSTGVKFTIIMTAVSSLIYVVSFIMSILVLKTEKKAQAKALGIMKSENLATDDEIKMCKKLFKLYNIEYVNNMIVALLELVYRILQIFGYVQGSSSSTNTLR